jgi:hypothetical protein
MPFRTETQIYRKRKPFGLGRQTRKVPLPYHEQWDEPVFEPSLRNGRACCVSWRKAESFVGGAAH